MDPLSITASAGSIFGALISCTKTITSFVSTVRAARTEMDAVQQELTSLKLCLDVLEDDDEQYRVRYPEEMRTKIGDIKTNIEMNCIQIRNMLNKLQSGKLGRRIQWAASEREEINQFRSSLESNKASLEIMLQYGTVAIITRNTKGQQQSNRDISAVLQYAQATCDNTVEIGRKVDDLLSMQENCSRFDELRHELIKLRQQITALDTPKNQSFHCFLDQSRSYTQALLESLDPPPGYEDCLSVSEPTSQKDESGAFDDSTSTLVAPNIVIIDVDNAVFCPACAQEMDEAKLHVAQARLYEMQKQWRASWTEQLIHELACLQPADVLSVHEDAHCADSLSVNDISHVARLEDECDELRLHSQQLMGEIRSLQQRSAD
ncbi:hypothetical protein OHC33_008782 [Knufia fluminis]|uniref:Fungal N-terminal domain-containing protein n=1 Tax=Knufia fluminis TaxID=191047 RepID=A0AAN8EG97_9EURO|nr:hypothetical protein OHC33_008782 [Knufia fluminis]